MQSNMGDTDWCKKAKRLKQAAFRYKSELVTKRLENDQLRNEVNYCKRKMAALEKENGTGNKAIASTLAKLDERSCMLKDSQMETEQAMTKYRIAQKEICRLKKEISLLTEKRGCRTKQENLNQAQVESETSRCQMFEISSPTRNAMADMIAIDRLKTDLDDVTNRLSRNEASHCEEQERKKNDLIFLESHIQTLSHKLERLSQVNCSLTSENDALLEKLREKEARVTSLSQQVEQLSIKLNSNEQEMEKLSNAGIAGDWNQMELETQHHQQMAAKWKEECAKAVSLFEMKSVEIQRDRSTTQALVNQLLDSEKLLLQMEAALECQTNTIENLESRIRQTVAGLWMVPPTFDNVPQNGKSIGTAQCQNSPAQFIGSPAQWRCSTGRSSLGLSSSTLERHVRIRDELEQQLNNCNNYGSFSVSDPIDDVTTSSISQPWQCIV